MIFCLKLIWKLNNVENCSVCCLTMSIHPVLDKKNGISDYPTFHVVFPPSSDSIVLMEGGSAFLPSRQASLTPKIIPWKWY